MSENKTTGTSTAISTEPDEDLRQRESQHQENQAASGGTRWLISTIPIVVSVASLLISGLSFFVVLRTPQVELEMPTFIRAWQPEYKDGSALARFDVQPHFFYPGTSQRAEIVTDMRLFVDPKGDAVPIECIWLEQGTYGGDNFELTDLTNPAPIVLDPSTVGIPVAHFEPIYERWKDWQITPGQYKLTLRATRAVADEPLEATMVITIEDWHMPQIEDPKASAGFATIWKDTARKPTPPTKLPELEF